MILIDWEWKCTGFELDTHYYAKEGVNCTSVFLYDMKINVDDLIVQVAQTPLYMNTVMNLIISPL